MPELRSKSKLPTGLTFFVLAYMTACSAMALRQGNTEFVIYAGAMVVFIALVLSLHAAVRFSTLCLWLLALWGLLHMLGGTIPISQAYADTDSNRFVLYAFRLHPSLPRYDQITHAFGFFAATVACWESCRSLLGARSGVPLSAAAALMGMGLGCINEVIEFYITLTMPDNGVGGYINTGWDLVSNTVGCIAAGIWCLTRR
ncbi:MAG: DUF2238 domain-containing protein [Phycisphaerales bacterium]